MGLCKVLIWLSFPSLTYPFLLSDRHCVSEWFIPRALSILSVCVTLKYQPTCWMADPCLKDQFPISLQKSLESPTVYGLGLGSVGTDRMSRGGDCFLCGGKQAHGYSLSVCGRCSNSMESFALSTPQKTHICFVPVLLKQQIEFWLKQWQWQLWVTYSGKSNWERDALRLLRENQAVPAAPDVNSLIVRLLFVIEVYLSTAKCFITVWSVLQ